jgi:hypothetical protein
MSQQQIRKQRHGGGDPAGRAERHHVQLGREYRPADLRRELTRLYREHELSAEQYAALTEDTCLIRVP